MNVSPLSASRAPHRRRPGAHRRPAVAPPASVVARRLLAAVVVVALFGSGTYGSFRATGNNGSNSIASGTVAVTANDSGTALFNLSGMRPGDVSTRCIKITYSGTLQSSVRFYGATSGTALDEYLDLKVTRGTYTPTEPAYGSCTNFAADAPNYLGKGAGVIYDGTLRDFADDYAGGTDDPLNGAPESWVQNETHIYRFQLTMQDAPPSAQGRNATQTFRWEARNGDGTPYRSAVLATSGLVHYYRLGEASGTTAADSKGTASGTYAGTPARNSAGALDAESSNGAVGFDSSEDSVNLSSLAVNTTAGMYNTVEFWMHWNGSPLQVAFAFGTPQYDLYFEGISFGFNTANSDLYGTSSAGMANRWVHVAAQFYNGDGKQSRLWIDGVERPLSQVTGTTTSRTATTTARLGGFVGDNTVPFGGKIDELAIYNRALTSTEILSHYNAR